MSGLRRTPSHGPSVACTGTKFMAGYDYSGYDYESFYAQLPGEIVQRPGCDCDLFPPKLGRLFMYMFVLQVPLFWTDLF